jgi:hypothetical protein
VTIVTVSLARMFLVLLLLTPVVSGEAADQTAPALQEAHAAPASSVIPLAEVPSALHRALGASAVP